YRRHRIPAYLRPTARSRTRARDVFLHGYLRGHVDRYRRDQHVGQARQLTTQAGIFSDLANGGLRAAAPARPGRDWTPDRWPCCASGRRDNEAITKAPTRVDGPATIPGFRR